MTNLEKISIASAVKHGYTFKNDSQFNSFSTGNRVIMKLVNKGYLVRVDDGNGVEYQPTQAARDFIKYGI